VLGTLALIAMRQDDFAQAQAKYEQAIETYRQTGDQWGLATTLNYLAELRRYKGDLEGSIQVYNEAMKIYREIDSKSGLAMVTNNIASVLLDEGDLFRAPQMFEQSLSLFRELGRKDALGVLMSNIAQAMYYQGRLSKAEELLEKALLADRESGDERNTAYVFSQLADIAVARGDLAEARQNYQRALEIRDKIGDKMEAAEIRVMLAELSIEEGRPADAVEPARQAASNFQQQKQTDDELLSEIVLCRALLALGKNLDAQKLMDDSSEVASKSRNRGVMLKQAITAARIQTALGAFKKANAMLSSTVAETKKTGFLGYEFDARLALGEIEMKSDQTSLGRARLARLEKDARAKGFLLIVRKTAAVAKG
jgi:tetratricopeptide (TPR) repeat protein